MWSPLGISMSYLQPRPTQTQVKHLVLKEYIRRWGFIISNGLRRSAQQYGTSSRPFKVRFIYVDCFAHTGKYGPDIEVENNEAVFGSPIIGIEALDGIQKYAIDNWGFAPEIYSILIEQNEDFCNQLKETLVQRGFGNRIRETSDFLNLNTNEIAIVRGDYLDYLQSLLAFTSLKFTWAFYLLDPYGPKGIPFGAVGPIISQKHADVMINFPYQELHKKSRSAAENIPIHKGHSQRLDDMFGTKEWRGIPKRYFGVESNERSEQMESELVDFYHERLQKKDGDLAVKSIRLRFPDKERTMFYLFLTTHDPTGALALNEILDEASLREYELRETHKRQVKLGGQTSFLGTVMEDPGKPTIIRPDTPEIADAIYNTCSGETITFKEVQRRLCDESFYPSELKKAMTVLKRKKVAKYNKLNNRTEIVFS